MTDTTSLSGFIVRRVGEIEEPDIGCYTCAVAENRDGTGDHLMFQRSLTDDSDEVPYCLVMSTGPTHSGDVVWWSLKDRILVVQLNDKADAVFRVGGCFRLDLHELDDDALRTLEVGVTRVLAEVPRKEAP